MRKIHILISADIELFLRLERTFLLREEFHLVTANSGREVLEFVRKINLDIIFLDLFLPDMEGDECCLILKGDERYRPIPVIMVVNNEQQSDFERCQRAGCDAIVTRPINRPAFLGTLQKFLQIQERFPPRYPFRLVVQYESSPFKFTRGDSVNLSTGGLFIETDHPLVVNTLLTVEIFAPHEGTSIRCNASVAWINSPAHLQNQGLPSGMGLRFVDLKVRDLEWIQRIILHGSPGLLEQSLLPKVASKEEDEAAKILIVDDNPAHRKRIRSILVQEQYRILEAADCEEAFALAVKEHPDLVIMDAALPGEKGRDLYTKLKQSYESRLIPVLFLSGWTFFLGDSSKARESGVTDYISRPFRERDILARVRNSLRIHQLSDSLFKMRRQLLAKDLDQEESMRAAAVIQQSLLPVAMPQVLTFDFAWRFMPCESVGGDLFNIFKLDETHVGVYILDVSGQGVAAAMMATSVAQALNPANSRFLKVITDSPPFYELISPSQVLDKLNREYPIERFEKHFTICYLLLDVQSGRLCYSNAAHPFPLLVRTDGRI